MSLNLINEPSQQTAPSREATLRTKLEAVRTSLRLVQRDIQAVEGRFLDFDTAETLQGSLRHSIKLLEAISITVAVLERKEAR